MRRIVDRFAAREALAASRGRVQSRPTQKTKISGRTSCPTTATGAARPAMSRAAICSSRSGSPARVAGEAAGAAELLGVIEIGLAPAQRCFGRPTLGILARELGVEGLEAV